jgi:prephenate dehydratase
MTILKVGVSGDEGSFSENAAFTYLNSNNIENYEIKYLLNMENVLKSLSFNEIDYGVFPVANSIVGLITQAIDAMGKYQFKRVALLDLNVEHYLFAKQKLDIASIKKIYSFAPAILQCQNYINKIFPNAEIIDWGDMALAARDLSNSKISDDCAVIGSKFAAELYNLVILDEKIQDSAENKTMFMVVSKPG